MSESTATVISPLELLLLYPSIVMSYFQGGALASAPLNMQHVPQMNGLCTRCGYAGSDVKVLTCGCSFHAVSKFHKDIHALLKNQ